MRTAPAPDASPPTTTPASTPDGGTDAGAAPTTPVVPPKLMVVGDSVAGTLGLGFQNLSASTGLTVWNRGRLGCGMFYDGSIYEGGELTPVGAGDWRVEWPAELQLFKPDVVMLLVGAWDILDGDVDGHLVKFGSVEYDTSVPRRRKTRIPPTGQGDRFCRRFVVRRPILFLTRGRHADLRVVRQFFGPLASAVVRPPSASACSRHAIRRSR